MFTKRGNEIFLETARQACRWYMNNQNTDEHPWGGLANSADKGRFIYEYYPAQKRGRGAGVWAQALGIMALDALTVQSGGHDGEAAARKETALLAGDYMLTLQHKDRSREKNLGGFSEATPATTWSFPRDGITGALGLNALYRMTEDPKYLQAAELFADWYQYNGKDEQGWPYRNYDFELERGYHNKGDIYKEFEGHNPFVKGDWQIGGGLFYYQLTSLTGNNKYVDDYMLPMVEQLVQLYRENPVTEVQQGGFHGGTPVSFGNDDFALVTLMCAYCYTRRQEYLDIARERVIGLLALMDEETGSFPASGGTFVTGITIKVLIDLERALGNKPDTRLPEALEAVAKHGVELQAYDYNEIRVHGGFWGQTSHGVSRDRIHQRSTGYASIFYTMLAAQNRIPYYHCLGWGFDPGLTA